MISCENTIKSSMAPPRAFDYLSDLALLSEWHPSVLSSELEAGEPGLRRSRYRVVTAIGRARLDTEVEVVEVVRPHQFTYTAITRLSRSTHELTFLPHELGVEVRARSTVKLVPGLALLTPVADIYLRSYCHRRAEAMGAVLGEQIASGPTWHPGQSRHPAPHRPGY